MSLNAWRNRGGWVRVLSGLALVALFLLGAMEMIYRLQLIDCYRGELEQNNRPGDLKSPSDKKTLLIMGDSFAAQRDTFAFDLRRSLDEDWRTINSAIGGTGVIQAKILAPGRFHRFVPQLFLYEVYVGNDLFDLRYPSAWGRVSPLRSFYWLGSRNIRSLAWLNYKIGQIRARVFRPSLGKSGRIYHPQKDKFSPGKFERRDRIYAKAEPDMVADSVLLRGRRRRDFKTYLRALDALLGNCSTHECRVILIVIPHFSQLGPEAAQRAREIGFSIPDSPHYLNFDYPFVQALQQHLSKTRPQAILINPLETFAREERKGHKIYYRHDSHLNPIGQRLLAHLVLGELRKSKLVD